MKKTLKKHKQYKPQRLEQDGSVEQIRPPENMAVCEHQAISLKGKWRGLIATFAFFLVVAVLTLPRFPYPGDNFVPRNESIQLAKRGVLGIPYSMVSMIKGLDEPRGQYFFSNDAKERYYSKYGIAYTIAYLPPVWAELAVNPDFDMNKQTQAFFYKLGIYQIILGLLFVYYFYRLAMLFCTSQWLGCLFTLATIYSTFLWHYLRAPALEIYQLLAFVGVCWHGLVFFRRRLAADNTTVCWLHLLAAILWSGWLVLMRSNFVVLGFAVSALAFFVDPEAPRNWKRPFVTLGHFWKQYCWALIIPWIIIFTVLLTFNHIKFGSAFDSGYMQWLAADNTPRTKFGLALLVPNFRLFLLRIPNDFNMFKMYPYALLGVISFIPFARKRLMDAIFILAVVLPGVFLLLIYNMADGQWCYGPRYFLYYAMLLAFPCLWLLDVLLAKFRREFKVAVFIVCLIPVSYMSWQQLMVNSTHYFVNYQLGGILRSTKHPALIKYCKTPRWRFSRDLFYYGRGWDNYYPLQVIRPLIPPEREAEWQQFKMIVDEYSKPNFYFLPDSKLDAEKASGPVGPRRR